VAAIAMEIVNEIVKLIDAETKMLSNRRDEKTQDQENAQ
jgi:hypothetical protein